MFRIILFAILLAAASLTALAQQEPAQPPVPPKKSVVTAAQVNGVYRTGGSEFRVLALGPHKLKVQFNGQYMPVSGVPNLGYAIGEAIIDGNIATFIPNNTQGCELTLVFLPNKLKIIQSGTDVDCGFGHGVSAEGTYRRIKAGKPKFIALP